MIKDLIKYIQPLPPKLQILFIISSNNIESVDNNNSIKEFPFDLDDINKIQKLNNPYFLLFLYNNQDKINDILYQTEEILKINFKIIDKKISQYIYLCFLIEYMTEICNFQYSFELINILNEIQIGEKEILKKIFIAKMILSLVDYYNQIEDNEDNENNKHEEELEEIFNFNSKILDDKDNITILNEYEIKLKDLKQKKIEELYLIIIKYLIEKSKLEDSEFIENFINQIELESIYLTKLMLDELIKILTIEKEYIKKYEINNFNDIFDKKNIYFYYNLIRYILKQSLYIYQIPFLFETRKKILNLIKNNLRKLSTSIKNCENKYMIKYIIKQFIGDSSFKYYYKKSKSIIKKSKNNNYELNSSYLNDEESAQDMARNMNNDDINKSFGSSSIGAFSEKSYTSNKNSNSLEININISEEELYDKNELEYKILINSKFSLHTNKKGEIPFIIYDEIKIIKNENETENKTIEEIRNATTNDEKLSNNYKKFLSFLYKLESSLSKEFINNYKLKITLYFETQNFNYNDNFIINCIYEITFPEQEEIEMYKDENILINGLGVGFQYLLSEINSSLYSKIEYS